MRRIPLTRNKYAIVDDEDYEFLSPYKWHYNSDGYARRAIRISRTKIEVILMHRVIANTPPGMETDHINGDRLDNRRANLRVCSRGENLRNRKLSKNNQSGFKGVCWSKKAQKWQASIKFQSRNIYLGQYETLQEAAQVYNHAAQEIFGEYARINKINA